MKRLDKAGIIVCKGCTEEFDYRENHKESKETEICDRCFHDNEEAKRDFEAEKQYRDKKQPEKGGSMIDNKIPSKWKGGKYAKNEKFANIFIVFTVPGLYDMAAMAIPRMRA